MSLSLEELMKTLKQVQNKHPSPEPHLFDTLFYRPTFAGMNLYEAPAPQPKIKMNDIKFDDGSYIFDKAFVDKINAWLLERFGTDSCKVFKDNVYVFGNRCIMSKENMNTLINLNVT